VTITSSSGIDQAMMEQSLNLNVYPNPFSGAENVSYDLSQPSEVQLILYDMTGRQVATVIHETQSPGSYHYEINADKYHLEPGVYLLKMIAGEGAVSRQIMKL